jgi:hypothetical protein
MRKLQIFPIKYALYDKVIKVENKLKRFDSFVQPHLRPTVLSKVLYKIILFFTSGHTPDSDTYYVIN